MQSTSGESDATNVSLFFDAFARKVASEEATTEMVKGGPAAILFYIRGFSKTYAIDASKEGVAPQINSIVDPSTAFHGTNVRVCSVIYANARIFLGIMHRRRSLQRSWMLGEISLEGDKSVLRDLAYVLKLAAAASSSNPDAANAEGDLSTDYRSKREKQFQAKNNTNVMYTEYNALDEAVLELPIPSFAVAFLPAEAAIRGADDVLRYGIRCSVDMRGDGFTSDLEPDFDSQFMWDVHKRFSDFRSLDSSLRSELESRRFGTPGRRGQVPKLPKMPRKGYLFENQSSRQFILKRHRDLVIYCRQILNMLREGGSGEALLSPTICSFFSVPEHIWRAAQQRHFRRRQSIESSGSMKSRHRGDSTRSRGASSDFEQGYPLNNDSDMTPTRNDRGIDSMSSARSLKRKSYERGVTPSPSILYLDESREKLEEHRDSINLLTSQLSHQAEIVKNLQDIDERRILGHVRFLENFGPTSVTLLLGACSTLVIGSTLKDFLGNALRHLMLLNSWTSGGSSLFPATGLYRSSIRLAGAVGLTAFLWRAKWALEKACVKKNRWKRKLSIIYGTCIMLGGYKLTRWYSRYNKMDDYESKLLYSYTHKVMAKYANRCIVKWAGFWTKAGQYMSARADVVPTAFVKELSQLQDGTTPQDFSSVRQIVEDALAERHKDENSTAPVLEDVFSRFDECALASASIAQVHRATLKGVGSASDQDVVVKVQHAGIGELMRLDMVSLLYICRFVAWSEPEFDFEPLMTEWMKAAEKELDFVHEAANLTSVADGLSDPEKTPSRICDIVKVPRVYPKYTTRCVMVLEFSPGVSAGSERVQKSLDEFQKTELLKTVTEATAHQIFHIGIFNGDPHPGNILVELPDYSGTLTDEIRVAKPVLLDFGLSKHLSNELRMSFCKMIVAASEMDFVGLIEAFEDMGWEFEETHDFSETMDMLRFFFRDTAPRQEARKQLLDFDRALQSKVKARRATKVRRPVKAFPGDILFFVRALELLRGLCSQLCVRQSPMKIMAVSARQAISNALTAASLASFVDSASNPEDSTFSIPLSIPAHYRSKNAGDSAVQETYQQLEEKILNVVERLRADGTLLGCQVAVVVKGSLVVNVCAGPISPSEGDPRTVQPDSIFSSFSCTKAIAATALHMLIAEGKAKYEDPVSMHWPAFGCHGKENISISDVLSHRAGLSKNLPESLSIHMLCDSDRMADYLAGCSPEDGFDDGTARYHYLTFGWLVGKLVRILSGGIPIGDFIRDRIAIPLGLHNELMIGVPESWLPPCWDGRHTEVTRMHSNRLAVLDKVFDLGGNSSDEDGEDEMEAIVERMKGRAEQMRTQQQSNNVEISQKDKASAPSPLADMSFRGKEWSLDSRMWNAKRVRAACIPAANGHFSARALALFYSVLMAPIAGCKLPASDDSMRRIKTEHACDQGTQSRVQLLPEHALRQAVQSQTPVHDGDGEFGLGYRRHKYSLYNSKTGKEEELIGFGHAGIGGSIGLCVPHANVAFAFTTSRLNMNALPARELFNLVCAELNLGKCDELTKVADDNIVSNIT